MQYHLAYHYVIELNTNHELISKLKHNTTEFPDTESAIFCSNDYTDYETCITDMKDVLVKEMNSMMAELDRKFRIFWEENNFTDEEKEDHQNVLDELGWTDEEMIRLYGVDDALVTEDFTGHEWAFRARIFHKDEGRYIFPEHLTLQ